MRLRVLLSTPEPVTIPWDYRSALTGAVYEILAEADPQFSTWLHEQGFRWGKRAYRLFVYSDLMPIHYQPTPKGLAEVQRIYWYIGSPDPRFVEKFVLGLERKERQFRLYNIPVQVVELLCTETPPFKPGQAFRTISPVAVSIGDPQQSKHPIYLEPKDPRFEETLGSNLIAKWEAFHQRPWEGEAVRFQILKPRQKLVRTFHTAVRAWHLTARIWAPEDLIRFAYDAGLGIKNSQGFGMLEVIKSP